MRFRHSFAVCVILMVLSSPSTGQVAQLLNFEESPGTKTMSYDAVEVIAQPRDESDGMIQFVAAIRAKGFSPVLIEDGVPARAGYERWIGVGKLTPTDPIPSVLLASFTGGAHCCAAMKAIVPSAGKLKIIDFPWIDGGPDPEFPKDLDADGTVDFVRQDDRFRYQFASGAGSFSPPVIFNIFKGQLIDVSDQIGFKPLWAKFARETKVRCADQSDGDRNGACAAYVAAGARLGTYEEALKFAVKFANSKPSTDFPSSCKVSTEADKCSEQNIIKHYTFSSSIGSFLKTSGYVN